MLATNTLPPFKIVQFQGHSCDLQYRSKVSYHLLARQDSVFACALCQIEELAVSKQFSGCIVVTTQWNKNLLYHFHCQCQRWDPLPQKMVQEVGHTLPLAVCRLLYSALKSRWLCTWTHVCPPFFSPLPWVPRNKWADNLSHDKVWNTNLCINTM